MARKLATDLGESLDPVLLAGRVALGKRRYRDARTLLESAIVNHPTQLAPRVLLTHVLLDEGADWPAAEMALLNVLEMAPEHAEARHNLEVLRKQHGPASSQGCSLADLGQAWQFGYSSGPSRSWVMPSSLIDLLAELPDPRDPRGVRHPLVPVLTLCLVATLAGCSSLAAIAQFGRDRGVRFAHALGFRRGATPAPSTLSELLRNLDADALDASIGRWLAGRHAGGWDVVALDGKTVRGSRDGDTPGAHLLAAYAPQAAAVIGQLRVDAKTNEHKAALRLLGVLPPLAGAVVTGDAMFTHRDVCDAVRDRGGEYVLLAKGNQENLATDLADTFAGPADFSPPCPGPVG